MNREFGVTKRTANLRVPVGFAVLLSQFAWQQRAFPSEGVVATTQDKSAQAYRFKSFDAPAGGYFEPFSFNARGEIAGTYEIPICTGRPCGSTFHAFIYRDGNLTTLVVPPCSEGHTQAVSINDNGQITGSCSDASGEHGFISNGDAVKILDLPGATFTRPQSINNKGEVAGVYADSSAEHGFIYSGGLYTTLDFPGASYTSLYAMNAHGQAIGDYENTNDARTYSFLYSRGSFKKLDAPGARSGLTEPGSINSRGQVVGNYFLDSMDFCAYRGFLYSKGFYTSIAVPGACDTGAITINASGQVAGEYAPHNDTFGVFIYSSGKIAIVNDPDSNSTSWCGPIINDAGQIAGCYTIRQGYIATPVVAVLDYFNRDDGKLGPNWKGSVHLGEYKIVNQQVRVRTGGAIYWQPNPFGLDQEAFARLKRIDPNGVEQGLLLKAQGLSGNYQLGAIAVKYDAGRQVVWVATWRKVRSAWRNYREIPMKLVDGDRLGARVFADGRVEIYRNDNPFGSVTLCAADRTFFNGKTGRVGLWFEGAPKAIVDNFGGGTNMP